MCVRCPLNHPQEVVYETGFIDSESNSDNLSQSSVGFGVSGNVCTLLLPHTKPFPSHQELSHSSLLPSPTKDRPRPPQGRRLPTKCSPQQHQVEGEEDDGIQPVWVEEGMEEDEQPLVYNVAGSMIASSTPIENSEVGKGRWGVWSEHEMVYHPGL